LNLAFFSHCYRKVKTAYTALSVTIVTALLDFYHLQTAIFNLKLQLEIKNRSLKK